MRTEIAPNLFTGTAIENGLLAADGTLVTAYVADFQEPVGEGAVSDGVYVLRVFQYGSESFNGKTVTFKIGDLAANETAVWETFGATELNLTASK